jgi:hypothetical protein
MPADTPEPCHVCGDPLDRRAAALCDSCHRPFHLRLQQDSDDRECGEVWVDDQFLKLQHACHVCLGRRHQPGAPEPPVGPAH